MPLALSSPCSMGRPNAAVLPVPVCANPMRSAPSSRLGMARRWMGVGVSIPRSAKARHSLPSMPRPAKVSSDKEMMLGGGVNSGAHPEGWR